MSRLASDKFFCNARNARIRRKQNLSSDRGQADKFFCNVRNVCIFRRRSQVDRNCICSASRKSRPEDTSRGKKICGRRRIKKSRRLRQKFSARINFRVSREILRALRLKASPPPMSPQDKCIRKKSVRRVLS